MKCFILFSGKNKKNISKYGLLKILPNVLSVKSKGSSSKARLIAGPGIESSDPSLATELIW